ncbi:acyl-CoA synthetase [Manganibacter manganicus]|uniref:Acyl-CoA synthetase n=1 Tax=Manganibacter manganicus TaxID=1873176 RepID=A0A1V8RT54_9HYPH|nr:AMP-binding protein [Pseudaminobacter manganicus]OQM76357.1 acyl-CoA synthetase [Pseudaminobacter manganicus]
MDFSSVERDYGKAAQGFRLNIPEYFNFGFDVVDDWAARDDHTAVIAVSRDGETISHIPYSAFAENSNRFANALKAKGVEPGSFACVVMGRLPEWYTVLFGCMKAGVVSMPGTNLLTAHDLEYRVNHSRASVIVVGSEHCGKVDSIRARCPTLKTFIVTDGAHDGWLSLDRLLADASPDIDRAAFPKTRATDMMMAYFTSGTTSMPKMVPRDHGYALAHVATGLFWMDLRRTDIHWSLTDTGWAKAAWGILFPQFALGVPIVLYDGPAAFDADLHLKLIGKLGVTTFCAPPTVYRLFAQFDLSQYDLSSLRRSLGAGEPLNPEVMRIWKEATGTVIADGYGQTETINIVANFPAEEVRYGSMGKPVPGFDVDVVDDDGNRRPVGEVGHIAVRITEPHPGGLFHGYYTGKELDRTSFRNGWYYTGDTATRDKDGYLWFVGRSDDLISSAGYRISPFEVESALIEHKAVAESAVVGKADETRGQIVKAYVILAKGFSPSQELALDIQEFCRNLTAPYKYPREIEFVEALPKTISGKIRRVELRQQDRT